MSLGLLAHAAELKLPSDFWVIDKYQIKLSISVVEKDLYLTVFDKDREGNDITWEGRASLNRLGVFEGTWGNEKNDNIGPFIIYFTSEENGVLLLPGSELIIHKQSLIAI